MKTHVKWLLIISEGYQIFHSATIHKFDHKLLKQLCVWTYHQFSQFSHSFLTLCDPMDCSTPGFPVHHQLLEPIQTHVHHVSDANQPSHPLSSPSPSAFSLFQHPGLFSESFLHIRWPKFGASASASVLPMNIQNWFPLVLTGLMSLQSWDSQESSPTLQVKSINSLALSLLYGPTLTSLHDSWKNHSFET